MKKVLLLITAVCFVAGCGETPKKEPKKKLSRVEELHRKAKFTEAAGIVGYDGKAIHKNLDKMIKAREQQTTDLNKAVKDMQ